MFIASAPDVYKEWTEKNVYINNFKLVKTNLDLILKSISNGRL